MDTNTVTLNIKFSNETYHDIEVATMRCFYGTRHHVSAVNCFYNTHTITLFEGQIYSTGNSSCCISGQYQVNIFANTNTYNSQYDCFRICYKDKNIWIGAELRRTEDKDDIIKTYIEENGLFETRDKLYVLK